MQAEKIQSLSLISPNYYFTNALKLIKAHQVDDALKYIDSAILFSNHAPFYIYQKIKLLYVLGFHDDCHHFINLQFSYLYEKSSLYILCRTLDYYQKLTQCTESELCTFLNKHHAPYCLAFHYTYWLKTRKRKILDIAQYTLSQDLWSLCLDYCKLYLKGYPPTYKGFYLQALAYHKQGHLYKAQEMIELCLLEKPQDAALYDHLGCIQLERYDLESALCSFKKASQLAPDEITYLFHIGECYMTARSYEDAYHFFKKLEERYPNNQQLTFHLLFLSSQCTNPLATKYYHKKLKREMQ